MTCWVFMLQIVTVMKVFNHQNAIRQGAVFTFKSGSHTFLENTVLFLNQTETNDLSM